MHFTPGTLLKVRGVKAVRITLRLAVTPVGLTYPGHETGSPSDFILLWSMTDRALLSAAARDIRALMKRRQVTDQVALLETDPTAWARPDPELETLAVEIDEVMYGRRRAEMPGLVERIAAVLGDDWEPSS